MRNWTVKFIAMLVVVIVAASACANAWAPGGAVLIGSQGNVEVRAGGTSWKAAALKQALPAGSSVRTASGGGAVLMFPNGSTIKLNGDSLFTLPGDGEDGFEGAALDEGELWGLLDTGGELLEISTPAAVLGVRGTEFALLVKKGGESTVTVVAGTTSFSNEHGGVKVSTSEQSTARPGEAPTPPRVVDTTNWIKWTLELRAMGSAIDTPFYDMDRRELERALGEMLDKLEETGSAQDQLEYARALYDLGEYTDAATEFSGCADYEATVWDCLYGLGLSALAGGGVDEALDYFDEMAWSVEDYTKRYTSEKYKDETDPYMASALSGFGLAYLKEGDAKEALKFFEEAADYNPDLALAYLGIGESMMRLGRARDAEKELETALEIDPDSYQALARLAAVRMSLNRPGPALDSALAAVKAAPDSAWAHSMAARIYFFREEFSQAETEARKASKLDPYDPAAHEVLARLLIRDGDMKGAVREALISYAFDELNPYANDDLALIYYTYRKYYEAIRHWEKAIAAAPGFAGAKIHLAHLYNELEETEKAQRAEQLMREVLAGKEGPDRAEALSELGRALEMMRKYDEAEDAYMEALELDPEDALNLRRLAEFYIRSNWMDLALEYALRAVASQPGNPANYFTLGRAYEAVSNVEGAESAYYTAVVLDPEYALARYQLGAMYADKGKTRDSLSEMLTGILMQPRIITQAEYRGQTRIGASAGSEKLRSYEIVHTGASDNYRFNYNLYYSHEDADGDRAGSDLDSNSYNLMAGYQADADSSFVLHLLRADTDNNKLPSTNYAYTDDILDNRTLFDMEQNSLSYRHALSPKSDLTLKAEKSRADSDTRETYFQGVFTSNSDSEIDTTEYEINLNVDKSDRFEYSLGAYWIKTDFDTVNTLTQYDIFTGAVLFQSVSPFRMDSKQRNTYFQFTLHDIKPKLDFTGGVENALRDDSGSEVIYKLILEYRPEEGAWLRLVRRSLYFLDGFPMYRPRDGWISMDEYDAGATGSDTTEHELEYEKRFESGAFFRGSVYVRKTWDRFGPVTDTDGYKARYEKPLSRKANYFVAVAHNNTDYDRYFYWTQDGMGGISLKELDGKTVPYKQSTDYEIGLYYFFNSRFSLKATHNKYGDRYADEDNTVRLDDYALTNLYFRYEPAIDQSYLLKIRNVFDKEYQKTYGQTEDGRNWELSFKRWF